MKIGNCLIAQSGGPTAAINATLAGVYSAAKKQFAIGRIYGGMNGIEGIMKGNIIDLSSVLDKDENLKLLKTTPSSFLGSCRYKLKGGSEGQSEFQKLFKVFEENNIKYFFYIGGNDSMDTILQLEEYQVANGGDVTFVGVPKTIDNDLCCIDHTPGFGSAAKYIATTIKEIAADTAVYDMDSIVVVEVMGRNAGWLALSAALALDSKGRCMADLIYLPENVFDYDKFIEDVKKVQQTKRQIVVVVSEGIKLADGSLISEAKTKDSFGHGQLGGAAKHVEAVIQERIGVKVRAVEINVLQRCAGHLLSARDINESFMLGEKAVEVASEGKSGVMVTTERARNGFYSITMGATDIRLIANKEKTVPEDYMNEAKNAATQKALDYLMPLIQGEIAPVMQNGIPKHLLLRDYI
ncbi:MAG TPA: 6-phosphofructokinase [Lachnospiraceae bacterium]|nr:6-phosphofructokinase [Lachnospiraceae bacterium]